MYVVQVQMRADAGHCPSWRYYLAVQKGEIYISRAINSPTLHAGGCPGLGADVHICGRICFHGDADVPNVRILVLRSGLEAHRADFPLDGRAAI